MTKRIFVNRELKSPRGFSWLSKMPCSAKLTPLKTQKMRSPGINQQNLNCDPLKCQSLELLACSPDEFSAGGFSEPDAPEQHVLSAGKLQSAFVFILLGVFGTRIPAF